MVATVIISKACFCVLLAFRWNFCLKEEKEMRDVVMALILPHLSVLVSMPPVTLDLGNYLSN